MTSTKSKNNEGDGIYLHKHKSRELDMAIISLKVGIEAYFSTYQPFIRFLSIVESQPRKDEFDYEESVDFFEKIHIGNYQISRESYTRAYIETIFHFHHFIEVSIKEILRQEHELLASVAGQKHVILHKLLKGEEVTFDEKGKLNSLSSRDATERLEKLISEKRIKNHENMNFIVKAKFLKELDFLRNRLVHRGTFILRYTDLDILVGKNILPFILMILNLPIYKSNKSLWQPKKLDCGINVIQNIIDECNKSKPNFQKIAFCKEMGRASFKNPVPPKRKGRLYGIKESMEKRAVEEANNMEAVDIVKCLVCGLDSLIRYRDINLDEDEIGTLKCICCSFEVNSELYKVSLGGINIKSLWESN